MSKYTLWLILGITIITTGVGCNQQPTSLPEPATPPVSMPVPEAKPAPTSAEASVDKPADKPVPAPVTVPKTNPPTASKTHKVAISDFSFQPAVITIKAGDTVVWQQDDQAPHSVVISNGAASSLLEAGQTFSHTFTTPGNFAYHCGPHPFMTGTVKVE